MLDPWRRMEDWNKPANVSDEEFRHIYQEAMDRTDFAASRRIILRGTTLEMADQIPDDSLDFAYIDGDHTLRGVTIDLMCIYPKLKQGGILAGDDYSPSIWHHPASFEPTLVCPYAAYFAESQKAPLVIHGHNQFVIIKPFEQGSHFRVMDMCNGYGSRDLLPQVAPYRDWETDRKSTRLNSSHSRASRMPSSA